MIIDLIEGERYASKRHHTFQHRTAATATATTVTVNEFATVIIAGNAT